MAAQDYEWKGYFRVRFPWINITRIFEIEDYTKNGGGQLACWWNATKIWFRVWKNELWKCFYFLPNGHLSNEQVNIRGSLLFMTNLHVRLSALDHKWHIKEVLFFKAFDFLTVWIEIFIWTWLLKNYRKSGKISIKRCKYMKMKCPLFST